MKISDQSKAKLKMLFLSAAEVGAEMLTKKARQKVKAAIVVTQLGAECVRAVLEAKAETVTYHEETYENPKKPSNAKASKGPVKP